MAKQRMTSLDVRATVQELRKTLVGLRLLNLYNLTNKMFLFKFGQGENKRNVLLENGVRMHLTELEREKPKVPSQFTLKLRKHIRAWRLESIEQLQHDRTIDLCFGVAKTEGCFHIIVELFAKGNVILTDHAYRIMMLLHTHRSDEGPNLMVNNIYPVTAPPVTTAEGGQAEEEEERSTTTAFGAASQPAFSGTSQGTPENSHVFLYPPSVDASGHLRVQRTPDAELDATQRQLKGDRTRLLRAEWELGVRRSDQRTTLQALVAGIQHFGPDLAQHILTTIADTPHGQQKNWRPFADDLFAALLPALLEAYDLAKIDLQNAGGFLVRSIAQAKRGSAALPQGEGMAAATATASVDDEHPELGRRVVMAEQFDSFTPILMAQYVNADDVELLYRPSFGQVCDEYFLMTETGRIEAANEKRKTTAKGKEDKFAVDHARRIRTLEGDIDKNQQKGEQLILNADRVDAAIQLINGALATGITWDALRSLLKRRHAEGHPVAYMVHDLFLERNAISVLLENPLDEDEGEEDADVQPMVVEVALSKTAHANAADYFGKRKQHQSKLQRTVASTEKATAGAARKGARKAAEKKAKKTILKARHRNWWEKWLWFRTSAGDLVLRGKDVQTTELLVRRVMRLGDLFIHCDVDGALPCLLRPLGNMWRGRLGRGGMETADAHAAQPVALQSLYEAGAWCVAFSGAWESKQTCGSWWVYASQVTGGSATGAYLYAGERHHLPPQPMPLGCALLFYVARTVDEDGGAGMQDATKADSAEQEDADPQSVLRRELPSLLPLTNGGGASTMGLLVPADPATALADLPSVEALRAEQRQQQRSVRVGGGGADGSRAEARPEKQSKPNVAATRKSGGGARNSRVDREGLRGTTRPTVACLPAPELGTSVETTAIAGGGGGCRTAAATTAAGAALTKHQRKKLKKIQEKYGEQDDEDRLLGARVNGNELSRVQLLELQRRATQREREEAARQAEEKMARDAQRAAGKLRYRMVDDADNDDNNEEDEGDVEAEVVSEFTDDGEEEADAAGAAQPRGSPSDGSDGNVDDDVAQAEGGSGDHDGASLSRLDRSAVVLQQALELQRVFPHYTMCPTTGDVVQHVVAVCAPMMVVSEYAFHAALAAGNTKKGVLAGKLLQVFTAHAEQGHARTLSAPSSTATRQRGGRGGTLGTVAVAGDAPLSSCSTTSMVADVNPSLVETLKLMSTDELVEQLRANVKPIDSRM